MRFRFLFGWGGGLSIQFLAYTIFLVPNPEEAQGYSNYATFGALTMIFAALIAAVATHKRIVIQYKASNLEPAAAHGFAEMSKAFRYRPFLLLMLAGIFAFTNQWLVFALSIYLFYPCMGIQPNPIQYLLCYAFHSCPNCVLSGNANFSPNRQSKSSSFIDPNLIESWYCPILAKISKLFPGPGDTMSFSILLCFLVAATASGISAMILTLSMIADVSDHYEYENKRKSEGLFSSGMFFMQKVVNGIGILISGIIIAAIGLPKGASAGSVDAVIVDNLALSYLLIATLISLIGAWTYTLFPCEKEHLMRQTKKEGWCLIPNL